MLARPRHFAAVAAFAAAALIATSASAQKKYDPGASDTEIRIGNIMPYSGPASSYGVIGKTEAAFFNMINAEGGINGRKINFISYDDALQPAEGDRAGAQAGRERRGALLIFQPLGTPSNSAIQKYMNAKKVPQLFVASGATKWGDPKHFPVDDGLSAQLPERRTDLRQIHSRPLSQQQDRGVLAERRRRQGSGQGIARRARRQGEHDHRRQILRGQRSHDRLPDRRAARFRRRHLLLLGGAEGIGAGDPQGRRARLEAEILPCQYRDLGRFGVEAGGSRIRQGYHFDDLSEGSDRPSLEERSGGKEVARPSWTSIIRTATRPTPTTSTATCRRRPWCRCSSSAATI